jgi:hypothetical protein
MPLFQAPPGYKFLEEGDRIRAGDVVFTDWGKADFAIGPNHPEIGNIWDYSCMPMARKAAANSESQVGPSIG